MKKRNLFYLFLPIAIGGIVGFLISGNIDYNELIKPPLAPPKILFPIMWSIIYLLMGLSFYLYKKNNQAFTFGDKIYYFQLVINALWSIIFFLLKLRFLAVLWIILLVLLVAILLFLFYKKEKISFYLNILYLVWCLFATYLTIGFYILN